MKIKKCILIITFFCILFNCYGCYKPSNEANLYINNNSNNDRSREKETIKTLDYNNDDFNINWGYGCKLNGVVYTVYNGNLRYFENGKLKYICRDPLCKHTEFNCASSKAVYFYLVATDGVKLYCFGNHFERNSNYQKDKEAGRTPDKPEYLMNDSIYEIDTETQKINILTKWEETGMMIPLIRVHNDYIYYLIVTSESKSDLYRVKKSGGNAELVSKNNDSRIFNAVFNDNYVLYGKNRTYYKADIDFESSKLFTNETLAFITFKDNYIYYAVGSQKSYSCIGSEKNVSLHYADIFRIRIEDIDDFTRAELLLNDVALPDEFIITDNKIIYLPVDPVYKGKISLKGLDGMVDLYNYSNGKVMTLDLKTLEKKTVCTEMIDGSSKMDYADDNQAFFYNNEKQKAYRLDINTGKLTELTEEK